MKRKTPLRRSLETQREWERRSRQKQIEAQKRGAGLKRSRINPVNRKRRASEWARAYGSEERVRAIKALPCEVPKCRRRPCVNAHTESGGTGRKADWDTVAPLCAWHHTDGPDSYHALGSCEAFDRAHKTDLKARAAVLARTIPA